MPDAEVEQGMAGAFLETYEKGRSACVTLTHDIQIFEARGKVHTSFGKVLFGGGRARLGEL